MESVGSSFMRLLKLSQPMKPSDEALGMKRRRSKSECGAEGSLSMRPMLLKQLPLFERSAVASSGRLESGHD